MSDSPTPFERLGGEPGLRAIIDDFIERVFADVMIGFIFEGKPKARIAEMEYQLAAQQLGGPVVYSGRDIGAVHRRLPIMGGHFARRRQILLNTLEAHGADDEVVAQWMAHIDSLREVVLGRGVAEETCNHGTQGLRQES